MNASDHVANENILQFGRCTSLTNPNGLVGTSMVAGLDNRKQASVLLRGNYFHLSGKGRGC